MAVGKQLRFEILKRDGFRCHYCGATPDKTELRVDHIVPRANGGSDDPINLVTACFDCNAGKTDRELHEARADVATPHDVVVARARSAQEFLETQEAARVAAARLAAGVEKLWSDTVSTVVPRQLQSALPRLVAEWPLEELEAAVEAVARAVGARRCNGSEHRARYFFAVLRSRKEEVEREAMTEEEIAAEFQARITDAAERFERGDHGGAVREYRSALRCREDRAVRFELGRALICDGRHADARDIFRDLYAAGYSTWASCMNLGHAEAALGGDPRPFFAKAVDLTDDPDMRSRAAFCLEEVNKSERKRLDRQRRDDEYRAAAAETRRQAEELALARKTAARDAGRSFTHEVLGRVAELASAVDSLRLDDLIADAVLVEIAARHHRDANGLRSAIGAAMSGRGPILGIGWTRKTEGGKPVVPAVYVPVSARVHGGV